MPRQRRRKETLTTVPPTEKDLRLALDQLLAYHREWESISLGHRKERSFVIVWGLIAHTIAQVEAALILLDDPKLGLCAEANARVAYEHALLAQYAHQHQDGEAQLERLLDFYDHKLGVTMDRLRLQGELGEFASRSASERVRPPDIAEFAKLSEKFDTSGWLYASYKMLCQSVHPSSLTLARYLVVEESTGRVLNTLKYATPGSKDAVLWTLTLAVLLALGVQEHLRKGRSNMSKLRRAGAPVGMSPLLQLVGDTRV